MKGLLRRVTSFPFTLAGVLSFGVMLLEAGDALLAGPLVQLLQWPAYLSGMLVAWVTGTVFGGPPPQALWFAVLEVPLHLMPFIVVDLALARATSGGPRPAAVLLACIVVISSCGSTEELPVVRADHDVEGLPELALEEEMRIGSLDDPDYGFSRIGGADVDEEGRLYVYEGLDGEVRVYAPDGRLLRRMGREGDGPGEFRSSRPRFGVSGDTIWIIEPDRRRMTFYRIDGTLLDAVRTEEIRIPYHRMGQKAPVVPVVPGADGLFIGDRLVGVSEPASGNPPQQPDTIPVPRVRFAGDGTTVDTAGWYGVPASSTYFPAELVDVGSASYIVPSPPETYPFMITRADGLIRVDRKVATNAAGDIFRVTRYDLSGRELRSRTYRYQPVGFTDAHLDSIAHLYSGRVATRVGASLLSFEDRPADSARARVAIRNAMDYPPFQPPVRSYRVGDNGALWLRLEERGGPNHRWLVLDTTDAPVGEIELPRDLEIPWSRGEAAWGVVRDTFDVPWLVRYRMRERGE